MPSGEVFTGPVEGSASGVVRFSIPSSPRGVEVSGVSLEFRDGVVVSAHAERGDEVLQAMLATDDGARRLGEIGIGTNFGIDRAVGSTLFDEKIGGTVHLALGRSYPETGGTNESAIHWDLICDLRRGGRLSADGRPVVEDGRLVLWGELRRLAPNGRDMRAESATEARDRGARDPSARRGDAIAAAASSASATPASTAASSATGSTAFIAGFSPWVTPCSRIEGRWMAATLRDGTSVLSHGTAAQRVGSAAASEPGAIHVTVSGDAGRKRRAGIHLHRSAETRAGRDDHMPRHPDHHPASARSSTSPRTLAVGPLEQALDLADQRGLVDFAELKARSKPTRPAAPDKRCCPVHGRELQ